VRNSSIFHTTSIHNQYSYCNCNMGRRRKLGEAQGNDGPVQKKKMNAPDAGTNAIAQGADSDRSHASHESAASDSEASTQSASTTDLPFQKMEQIASFYEGHPMFYDLSDENYKNNPAKESALAKFAGEIGLSGELSVVTYWNFLLN